MIIGLDPHFECLTMRLADIGVSLACHVTKPSFIASVDGYGHTITWVFFSVFVAFRHFGKSHIASENMAKKRQLQTNSQKKCDFCKKDLDSEDKGYHTRSDVNPPTGPMRNENKESFVLTRTHLKALRIIARETKMPVAVQLVHAHMQWITKKDRSKK
jgi:hypothetical protein